ncbi:hypothetical protein BGZ61DRAFT_286596, partial [Ilyonectria robusta]|uniref:uncharacterized protein n=1 Tax=Ilyonectria robusta TaxID=1079257 RepID=UPI001E8CE066
VRNLQLLPLAGVFSSIGLSGTCFPWVKCQENYIWLVRHLFLPGLSNSLIGLLSTFMNILTTQGGHVSV